MRTTFDARALRDALAGYGTAVVEASGIMGSPYDHVYIYLTDDREGAHIIVSDAYELEDRAGYLVGAYERFEAAGDVRYAATVTGAMELTSAARTRLR